MWKPINKQWMRRRGDVQGSSEVCPLPSTATMDLSGIMLTVSQQYLVLATLFRPQSSTWHPPLPWPSYILFKTVTSWGVTLWVHTSTSQDTHLKLVSWTLTHHPCILGIILRLSYYLLQHFTRCRHMHTCQPLLILLNHSHFSLLCPFNLHCCCNSLRPSDAYMHHKPRPSLVQIMACRLDGAKPSSKPMLEYC